MKFNLPTGKTVTFPTSFFFDLPDDAFQEEIENLIAMDCGYVDNSAFNDSVLLDGETSKKKKDIDVDSIPLDDLIDNDFIDQSFFFDDI